MDRYLWTIYGVILMYFIAGAVGFYVINRNKGRDAAQKSYIKFLTYFLIINILFLSMVFQPSFKIIALLILTGGFYELWGLFKRGGKKNPGFFIISTLIYLILGIGFYAFSHLDSYLLIFVFLITSIFDSFSQISGQLLGHHPILPVTSPNKTWEGTIGGGVIALISGFLLGGLYPMSFPVKILLVVGIVIAAFGGDALASLYKRTYRVKDFSRLIPGHGGILDRFDSLIASGAWTIFYSGFIFSSSL